jgi:predicted phage tail protein
LLLDLKPRFDWSTSTLPSGTVFDHYQLQVAKDSGFTIVAVDQNISGITNSEYTLLANLQSNTMYYWRVRAFNSLGQYSPWSSASYFREAMLPPVLSAPADGEKLFRLRPSFDWSDVAGATSYTIQVSAYISMSSPIVNTSVTASNYDPTTDLPKNMTLYWRVSTNGANGPSAWSLVRTLVTPNPPTTPSLSSPVVNALLVDLTPRLDWSTSSLPSGTVFSHYHLQVAIDSGFTNLMVNQNISGITNSEYTLPANLQPNTSYYWRVRAFNSLGHYSPWSSVSYFREAMLSPVLSTPANGATLTTLRPTFDWSDVAGATNYTIQISAYSSMSSPIVNTSVTASNYLPTIDLTKNIMLYWRIRTNGSNGPSEWSSVRNFLIALQ